MTSAPPPYTQHPNGSNVMTYSCAACGRTWGWKHAEIVKNEHGPQLDAHLAEHADALATGGRAKR